jgi:hypothetical protein
VDRDQYQGSIRTLARRLLLAIGFSAVAVAATLAAGDTDAASVAAITVAVAAASIACTASRSACTGSSGAPTTRSTRSAPCWRPRPRRCARTWTGASPS